MIQGITKLLKSADWQPLLYFLGNFSRSLLVLFKGVFQLEGSGQEIQEVVDKLNHLPRKTRGYKTPHQLFTGQQETLIAA